MGVWGEGYNDRGVGCSCTYLDFNLPGSTDVSLTKPLGGIHA